MSSAFSKPTSSVPSYPGSNYSWFLLIVFIIIPSSKIASQKAGEWPNFHGSDRTNLSAETSLLKAWDEKGPALLFTISGLGEGYSSTAITCENGVVYHWLFGFAPVKKT